MNEVRILQENIGIGDEPLSQPIPAMSSEMLVKTPPSDSEELHSEATKRKIAKSLMGKKNPAFKDGRRSYRRIAGAKKGEGVDHRNGDSTDNRPSNLKPYKLRGPERRSEER